MSESKLITLVPKEGLPTAMKPKANTPWCPHNHILVDEHNRTIECERCGTIMDAFDFCLHSAKMEAMQFYYIDEVKKEVERLRLIKDELEREVNNLKAKRRRLL